MSKTSTEILSSPVGPTYHMWDRDPGEAVVSYIDRDGNIDEIVVNFWTPDGIQDAAREYGIVSCMYCGEYCSPVLWEKGKQRDYGVCHDCMFDPDVRENWLEYFENPNRSGTAVWWSSRDVMLRFFRFLLEE